jgi:hypothetical protein
MSRERRYQPCQSYRAVASHKDPPIIQPDARCDLCLRVRLRACRQSRVSCFQDRQAVCLQRATHHFDSRCAVVLSSFDDWDVQTGIVGLALERDRAVCRVNLERELDQLVEAELVEFA